MYDAMKFKDIMFPVSWYEYLIVHYASCCALIILCCLIICKLHKDWSKFVLVEAVNCSHSLKFPYHYQQQNILLFSSFFFWCEAWVLLKMWCLLLICYSGCVFPICMECLCKCYSENLCLNSEELSFKEMLSMRLYHQVGHMTNSVSMTTTQHFQLHQAEMLCCCHWYTIRHMNYNIGSPSFSPNPCTFYCTFTL